MRLGLSLTLMQIAARRVVHLTGAYDRALEESHEAGFLTSVERRRFLAMERSRRDESAEPDWWGTPPTPPSTFGLDANLPIDREYLLPSLLEFSDRPDRSRTNRDPEDPDEGLAAVA